MKGSLALDLWGPTMPKLSKVFGQGSIRLNGKFRGEYEILCKNKRIPAIIEIG